MFRASAQAVVLGGIDTSARLDTVCLSVDTETTALTPIEPDWNAIQARYLDGDSSAELAEEYGTTANAIRLRASKGKWKDKQLRQLGENEVELGREVRGCLLISVLREARMFRMTDPALVPEVLDTMSKVRSRLIGDAARLLGWDRENDPLASMKSAACLDV